MEREEKGMEKKREEDGKTESNEWERGDKRIKKQSSEWERGEKRMGKGRKGDR